MNRAWSPAPRVMPHASPSVVGEYNRSPVVTRERLYIDMMQSVLGNTSKVLVDQRQGQSLLYLPLDKLMDSTSRGRQHQRWREQRCRVGVRAPLPDPAAAVEAPGAARSSNTRDATRGGRDSRN